MDKHTLMPHRGTRSDAYRPIFKVGDIVEHLVTKHRLRVGQILMARSEMAKQQFFTADQGFRERKSSNYVLVEFEQEAETVSPALAPRPLKLVLTDFIIDTYRQYSGDLIARTILEDLARVVGLEIVTTSISVRDKDQPR